MGRELVDAMWPREPVLTRARSRTRRLSRLSSSATMVRARVRFRFNARSHLASSAVLVRSQGKKGRKGRDDDDDDLFPGAAAAKPAEEDEAAAVEPPPAGKKEKVKTKGKKGKQDDDDEEDAPAPAPAAPAQPPAPEGVTRFKLTDLKTVIHAAIAEGLTPLVLDKSDDHKCDTFFNYTGDFAIIDAKAMALKHTTGEKKPVDECLDDTRKHLVACMKPPGNGCIAVLAMQQAAVDFVGKFNGETTLPLALFDKAGKSLIGVDNAISKPMFRDDETKEQGGMSNCGDEFGVVVSSYFSSEDIFDFVFKGDYGLPDKAKFKILELELES